MFKVNPSPPNEVLKSVGNNAEHCYRCIVYSAHGFLAGVVCLIIAMKSAASSPTELTLAGHHVCKTQASEMTFCGLAWVCKMHRMLV